MDWLATVGPLGHMPVAPGTFGALAALPLAWALAASPGWAHALLGGLAVGVSVLVAERYVGPGTEADPQEVVLDETVGALVALAAAPWSWPWVVAALLLFRVFDIVKPGPIGTLDRRCHGGFGIVIDDVAAGLAAGAVVLAARFALAGS